MTTPAAQAAAPAMTSHPRRPAVVGGLTDDTTALERDLHRAHEGRAALRVGVPDDADVKRAVRLLADHPFFLWVPETRLCPLSCKFAR